MQLALPLNDYAILIMQLKLSSSDMQCISQFALSNLLCVISLQLCSMILIFCLVFSCYVVGLSEDRSYGKLAPVGGFMFMAGWLAFAF